MAVLTPTRRPALSSKRAAGVAGIDGGIGLDHVADGDAVGGLDFAAEGRDDAGGQGLVVPERIADSEYRLSDPEV